jgi:hypothetical protein
MDSDSTSTSTLIPSSTLQNSNTTSSVQPSKNNTLSNTEPNSNQSNNNSSETSNQKTIGVKKEQQEQPQTRTQFQHFYPESSEMVTMMLAEPHLTAAVKLNPLVSMGWLNKRFSLEKFT